MTLFLSISEMSWVGHLWDFFCLQFFPHTMQKGNPSICVNMHRFLGSFQLAKQALVVTFFFFLSFFPLVKISYFFWFFWISRSKTSLRCYFMTPRSNFEFLKPISYTYFFFFNFFLAIFQKIPPHTSSSYCLLILPPHTSSLFLKLIWK